MRYSIEPRDRRYVKGYRFLSFAKNIGKNISNKSSQKLVGHAIKFGAAKVATNGIKPASKRAIQKTAEETDDLIGNKITDKITSVSKKPATELHAKKLHNEELQSYEGNNKIPKERYICPKERQQIIVELRLI